jgi:hypothetical protein
MRTVTSFILLLSVEHELDAPEDACLAAQLTVGVLQGTLGAMESPVAIAMVQDHEGNPLVAVRSVAQGAH